MVSYLFTILVSLAGAVEGQFSFNGEQTVLSAVRYETVYTPSAQGQLRLQALKAEGYSCQPKLQFVQCRKMFDAPTVVPSEISAANPGVQNVVFEAVQSMDLLNPGEDIALYEAAQNAIVDGKKYEMVKYLERPDLVKATVGDAHDSENYHSFIVNVDSVSVMESLNITDSKWVYTTYHVEFLLPKH